MVGSEMYVQEISQNGSNTRGNPWFRLRSPKHRENNNNCLLGFLCLGAVGYGDDNSLAEVRSCPDPNEVLRIALFWITRTSFTSIFILSSLFFFLEIIFFAALIIIAGVADESCVRIGGAPFNEEDTLFADAFALSWTTFSTVGYGNSYPALSSENDNKTNCAAIAILCSIESFIGVLYAGFCGAVLFGKVLRIQSVAQVEFSHPLVIRYGTAALKALKVSGDDDDEDDEEIAKTNGETSPGSSRIPCPVLEFRLINSMSDQVGGEIMDAKINCVVNVNAKNDDQTPAEQDPEPATTHRMEGGSLTSSGTKVLFGKKANDTKYNLVPRRRFTKLAIEAENHPFFKRVWLCRHIINEDSPILLPSVRDMIRENNGYWPEKLNHAEAIRSSIRFNVILVSLSGVSNISAVSVFSQKVYDFVDVVVGYRFVSLLYRGNDGDIKVNSDLINDVVVQKGGGAESLM